MKKLILSVALASLMGAANAQSNSIPGFVNDTAAPGDGLGGSMSGSTGPSSSTPGSSGYSGSSATGTPGTIAPPDTTQRQDDNLNTFDQQRMEDSNSQNLNNQNFNNQNLNVPQTQPNLPQTQPSNSTMPATGIGTGRGVGSGSVTP